jgi:cold shock CspA family protein
MPPSRDAEVSMSRGVVVRLERNHGFGFIQMKDGPEVFFHQRFLKLMRFRDIKVGSIVEFEIERGYRGLKAFNMRFAEDE